MNNFYKKRYMIALYTLDDDLITVCDNVRKLAKYLDKDVKQVYDIVHRHFYNKDKIMYVGDIVAEMHFIDMGEEVC